MTFDRHAPTGTGRCWGVTLYFNRLCILFILVVLVPVPFVRLSGPSSRAPRAIYITRHSSEWSSVRRGRLVLINANFLQKRLSPFCVISISLSTCSCLSYVSPGLVSPSPISVLTFTFRIRRRFLLTPWRRYQHFSQFPSPCLLLTSSITRRHRHRRLAGQSLKRLLPRRHQE